MIEEWRAVAIDDGRYRDRYEVSNTGQVRASPSVHVGGSKPGRILFQATDNKGYRQVYLYFSRRQHTVKVARLVAVAFLGPRPDGLTINHIDGDKGNNHIENLEYITHQENINHALLNIRGNWHIINGEKLTLADAVAKYGAPGVTAKVVRRRVNRYKWTVEHAIKTPIGRTGRPTDDVIASRQRQS